MRFCAYNITNQDGSLFPARVNTEALRVPKMFDIVVSVSVARRIITVAVRGNAPALNNIPEQGKGACALPTLRDDVWRYEEPMKCRRDDHSLYSTITGSTRIRDFN